MATQVERDGSVSGLNTAPVSARVERLQYLLEHLRSRTPITESALAEDETLAFAIERFFVQNVEIAVDINTRILVSAGRNMRVTSCDIFTLMILTC